MIPIVICIYEYYDKQVIKIIIFCLNIYNFIEILTNKKLRITAKYLTKCTFYVKTIYEKSCI